MVDVVLFHHVQGLTEGVLAFAERLRARGHVVHTPDLFEGQRPASVDDGFAYVGGVGDEALRERAAKAVGELPAELVFAGVSWGVATAQVLARTRPGARGPCSTRPSCR
jgi:dienelactone hydrolase